MFFGLREEFGEVFGLVLGPLFSRQASRKIIE
jgi:hypothetical protein